MAKVSLNSMSISRRGRRNLSTRATARRPRREQVRVDAVAHGERGRRVRFEPGVERGVEGGDVGVGQRRADAPAGAHPAAPARARERHVGVEPEHRRDAGASGRPGGLGRDAAGPVGALPGRIDAEHQRLARPGDRIGPRQPAEVRRHQHAAGPQHAPHFGERSLDVEVHPALAGDDGVEARVGERNRLRGSDDEVDREAFRARAFASGGDLAGGGRRCR